MRIEPGTVSYPRLTVQWNKSGLKELFTRGCGKQSLEVTECLQQFAGLDEVQTEGTNRRAQLMRILTEQEEDFICAILGQQLALTGSHLGTAEATKFINDFLNEIS